MNHPYLEVGQSVNFVDATGKIQKAEITQVFHADAARVEWNKHSAVAEFSEKKEPGTFHFPDDTTAGNQPKPTTPGAK